MTPPTTPDPGREAQSLNDRTRENIKLVKVLRGVSDDDIAKMGFTSRQVVADRVSGRTELSLNDVERFAAALGVSSDALVMPRTEMSSWLDENPTELPGSRKPPASVPDMKGRTSPRKAAAKKPAKRAPRRREA
jgi:transcriptional regulator with XRE-family HTH domain